MRRFIQFRMFLSIILLTFIFGCAGQNIKKEAEAVDTAVLTGIEVQDNRLSISSSKDFTFTIYSTDPYRTTIKIPDMTVGEFTDRIVSDKAGFTEIIPRQEDTAGPMVMIDVVLQNPSAVVPVYSDNTLTLLTKPEEHAVPEVSAAEAVVAAVPTEIEIDIDAVSPPDATEITGIDIEETAAGLRVMIEGNGSMVPDVFPVDDRIVVDVPDVTMAAPLPDEAVSPLKSIRAGKYRDKVRFVLDLDEGTNFDVTAIGSAIIITLQEGEAAVVEEIPSEIPAEAVAAAPRTERSQNKGKYLGKRISLDFQDADIVPIFRLLADISGYNIVVNPGVSGKITLKLINVPWDQALDLILRTFSLSKVEEGNIIRIVPTSVVAKELSEITRAKKARAEAGELVSRIFPINYAEINKLKDAIDTAKLLSSRGSITTDERGSTIIINDLEPNIEKVEQLIKDIDVEYMQARQVMIEAKIVEVNTDYTKDLGIQWGAGYSRARQGSTIQMGGISQIGGTGFSGNNFLVNMPAAAGSGTGGAIGFGYVNHSLNFALDLQLSALESTKKGKVLSNPKVMTMNNQEAKITQGRTIYLPVATADKTDFKAIDALLSLTVTPRIAPGGAIFMDLDITKDEPGLSVTEGGVDVIKNTVKTTVLVNNSDTIVIGGVFKSAAGVDNAAVPTLSKIPFLGRLFKKEKNVETKNEILIFITPTIVEFSSLK
ncbi:MAG: type IV pilus secretin PilQ [Nitrospirota bacterium]|nr:type IV pilus secretin PilQ [Nitrospirota bacterium]